MVIIQFRWYNHRCWKYTNQCIFCETNKSSN